MAEIRKATVADIQILLPLVQEYWCFEDIFGFEPGRIGVQLQRLLSEPQLGSGWIASKDGCGVGYLLAVYVFSLEHMGIMAETDEFFILRLYRVRVLETAESEFRRVGCTNIALQISRQNNAARTFCHRNQYSERSGYALLDKMLLL